LLYRRDMILGFALLAVLLGVIFIAFLTLRTLAVEGIHARTECVGVIEIVGQITSPDHVVEKLERYIQDDNILAIVLRLNTPGGGISATQEISETVKKAHAAGKKTIASMGAVAASGGYYIGAVCDTIVATPASITGSISAIAIFPEFSELLERIGVSISVRKSGEFKDVGSFARKMTKKDEAIIDSVIMDSHEQFVQAVSEGRNLDPEYVREYADGRVFTGKQALDIGFVDLLGTYQDAIDLAGDLVGLGKNPPVYKDKKELFLGEFIDGISQLMGRIMQKGASPISYLWVY